MVEKHYPVMLGETLELLEINPLGVYVDLTLGRGGHSSAILKKIPNGFLYSFDKDLEAIKETKKKLSKISKNFKLIHSDFGNLKKELEEKGVYKVDGIVADLGVSSPQIDNPQRGFSYNKDSKLDMRMNQEQKFSALEIVNKWSEEKLVEIFIKYGNVYLPKKIAKCIVQNRPIQRTLELADIIRNSLPAAVVRKKNPLKAVFQSIRIAVNSEIESLKKMLNSSVEILKKNGKLAVITFHSIEDKTVKNFFGKFIKNETGKLPIIEAKKFHVKTKKPSKKEIFENRRSRSAKLRVLTKI